MIRKVFNKKISKNMLIVLLLIVIIILYVINKNFVNNIVGGIFISIKSNTSKMTIDTISVIIASISLIVTIICNFIEKRKNITIEKNVRDQEKFENELDKILEFYSTMLQEYIGAHLDIHHDIENEQIVHFEIDSVSYLNNLIAKHSCIIKVMIDRLDFLYRLEYGPCYLKFKERINLINDKLNKALLNLSILVNRCMNNGVGFSDLQAKRINNTKTFYINSIRILYEDNIKDLYKLANECIEERYYISKK